MTLVRRAAGKISAVVVHYSTLWNKEWAEGLAREVDFIQSDWGALLWSLGSMRVLLDRRPAPIRTYDDLKRLVDKFVDLATTRNVFPFIFALQILTHGLRFFHRGSAVDHIGSLLVVAGCVMFGSFLFWDAHTRQKLIGDNYWPELIQVYRMNLERAAGIKNSPALWVAVGGLLLMFTGYAMEYHSRGAAYWSAGLFLALTSLMINGRRNARRRLEELDALLETKP